jgi:hypothetical protein
MSIKKLLGKVAVGAAVGALVIVGASAVVAQNDVHPGGDGTAAFGTGVFNAANLDNTALELPNASTSMKIQMDLQRRAYLYPQEVLPADVAAIDTLSRVDSVATYAGIPVGNVGRLWVETNYLGWDVVATLQNGGQLRKVLDAPVELTPEEINCYVVDFQGNTACDTTKATFKTVGDPLMFISSSATPASQPCSLQIGIGIIDIPAAPAAILTGTRTNVLVDTILDFSADNAPIGADGVTQTKWASFSWVIGTKVNNNTIAALAPFGTRVLGTSTGEYNIADNGFPLISAGRRVDLASMFGGENKQDFATQFFINARIDKDEDELLMGNKPGIYEETIEFQLFGVY